MMLRGDPGTWPMSRQARQSHHREALEDRVGTGIPRLAGPGYSGYANSLVLVFTMQHWDVTLVYPVCKQACLCHKVPAPTYDTV